MYLHILVTVTCNLRNIGVVTIVTSSKVLFVVNHSQYTKTIGSPETILVKTVLITVR